MEKTERINNFDLIRLFAALEVLINHTLHNFGYGRPSILAFTPGVPIFFTISGFLIFWSFSEKQNLKSYFASRALRIYPALWACFIFTAIVLTAMGFINSESLKQKEIIFWIVTQVTFLPILTPKSFAGFGIGNPNGSLWTIAVELQFYLAIPLLYYLIRKHTRWIQNAILIVLAFVSWYAGYRSKTMNADSILATIYISSLIPYLHFFIYGILLFVNFDVLKRFVVNRAQYWVLAYFSFVVLFHYGLHWYVAEYFPSLFSVLGMFLLSVTVIACAYTLPHIATKVLRHNDISYGLYLYQMVIINMFITLKMTDIKAIVLCWSISILLALGSWVIIEKPFIAMKKKVLAFLGT